MRTPDHDLRQTLAANRIPGAAGPGCLSERHLAALVEGTVSDTERGPMLAHVAACEWCRSSVASLSRALADPDIATEFRRATRSAPQISRRLVMLGLPLAAAAVALFFIRPEMGNEIPTELNPHRASSTGSRAVPRLISPAGLVEGVSALEWSAVPGADRYRVELFSNDGSVLFEKLVADTIALLPDSVALSPGNTYHWRVEARTGFDRWTPSGLVEISIRGRARQ
jgi:hypothetical protein